MVDADTSLSDALLEMSRKGFGMTLICDSEQRLRGVFTDGDLRRCFDRGLDVRTARMHEVMTSECKRVDAQMLAAEALRVMQEFRINALPVVDDSDHLVGVVNMHDMLRAGVL